MAPLPDPDAVAGETIIQLTSLKAFQPQPAPVVMLMRSLVAAAEYDSDVGLMEKFAAEPSWVMASCSDVATVIDPLRPGAQPLAVTVYGTVPLPVKVLAAAGAIWIQPVAEGVQVQLVVTWRLPVPPATGKFMVWGAKV